MSGARGPYKLRHPPPADEKQPTTDQEYLDSLRAENNRLRMHLHRLIRAWDARCIAGQSRPTPALQDALEQARKLVDSPGVAGD